MTTKVSQPTTNGSQKPKIKPAHDVVIEQSFELEALRTEVKRLRGLLAETVRALGLDDSEVDELPQKAAAILAEGSAACEEWYWKCQKFETASKAIQQERDKYLRDRDELDSIVVQKNAQIKQIKAELDAMTKRMIAVGKVAEAGRKLWQEYAALADDLPDDMRGDFKRCSYLAGRFADALKQLEDTSA